MDDYEKYLRDNGVAEPKASPIPAWAWPFIAIAGYKAVKYLYAAIIPYF